MEPEEAIVYTFTRRDGGVFVDPIPGDMLRLKYDMPQVSGLIWNYKRAI